MAGWNERVSLVEKAKKALALLAIKETDIEATHREADQILCRLLNELGFRDVVDLWDKLPKWWA